ncbi:DUF47 family protein [Limnohabitans sp.]|uniref:DUF47 family protein n=1 Tax=Limnohabitans sp. TaxID=1907725 RepID=UPI003340A82E
MEDEFLIVSSQEIFFDNLQENLSLMARPVIELRDATNENLCARCEVWRSHLKKFSTAEGISNATITALTHGDRKQNDSFHLLVMDLHKCINAIASTISTENIAGAHAWHVLPEDHARIEAFMHGLQRTAPLKFSHPGLDTAATRDDKRLLIQNDIGTNDAHVLVIEVRDKKIELTYSELHKGRFDFFRTMLENIGFEWQVFEPVITAELNAGKPYYVGKATFLAKKETDLLQALYMVGSRIVFVIDWNRARKRLQHFVCKKVAIKLLTQSAESEYGHMAWLLAGGEKLVYQTMQSVASDAFRIGDRLDEVCGEHAAELFLEDLMRMCSAMLLDQQPTSLIADEARMLLVHVLRKRSFEFDLLADHAAYCHALSQLLSQCLETSTEQTVISFKVFADQAKEWEHAADRLLTEARQRAERQPRWQSVVHLLSQSDDVADTLEESIFIISMLTRTPMHSITQEVGAVLARLVQATQAAIQDYIKAIQIARDITSDGTSQDTDAFLKVLWQMLRAERHCDELYREARLLIVTHLHDQPVAFGLTSDLAAAIESASDALLSVGHQLRKMVFEKNALTL